MEQFVDDYGIYFVFASMAFMAYAFIAPLLPRKKRKEDIWIARFVCFFCKGNGEAKGDPYFNCSICDGSGIISFPVRFGCSIYHEYRSKLDYKAKLSDGERKRFIGFSPAIPERARQ